MNGTIGQLKNIVHEQMFDVTVKGSDNIERDEMKATCCGIEIQGKCRTISKKQVTVLMCGLKVM
jgi:hypothetical protein